MSSIGMNIFIVCRRERDSETDKMLKSFFVWSAVCILPFKDKKDNNCRMCSTDWQTPPQAQST